MGITNFLLSRKIKKIEREAYSYFSKIVNEMEAASVKLCVDRMNQGKLGETITHLEEAEKGFNVLEKLDQKFVRLKERFKHNGNELLRIVVDWRDFNILTYKLLLNIESNWSDYRICAEEMMKRFNKLLSEE